VAQPAIEHPVQMACLSLLKINSHWASSSASNATRASLKQNVQPVPGPIFVQSLMLRKSVQISQFASITAQAETGQLATVIREGPKS